MPNTREKLIELCEDVILSCKASLCADCEHNQIDYPNCMGVHFADHLIANGVTLGNQVASSSKYLASSEWIPVTERLPDDICPVLVALEGLNISFHGWYQDEKWLSVGAGSRPFTQKVTHWMPLPEPPKENDSKP